MESKRRNSSPAHHPSDREIGSNTENATIGPGFAIKRALITEPSARPTSLAGCFALVSVHPDLPTWFREDVRCSAFLLASLTHCELAHLPSDPLELVPILSAVKPADARLDVARWIGIIRLVGSVLALCGWTTDQTDQRRMLH